MVHKSKLPLKYSWPQNSKIWDKQKHSQEKQKKKLGKFLIRKKIIFHICHSHKNVFQYSFFKSLLVILTIRAILFFFLHPRESPSTMIKCTRLSLAYFKALFESSRMIWTFSQSFATILVITRNTIGSKIIRLLR